MVVFDVVSSKRRPKPMDIQSIGFASTQHAALTDLFDISHRHVEEVRSDREAGSHDEYNEERHQAEPDMLLLHAAVVVAVVLRRHLGQLQHAPIITLNEPRAFMVVSRNGHIRYPRKGRFVKDTVQMRKVCP